MSSFSFFGGTVYGVCLIGHRVNHVQLAAPHLFEFLQEGNAVKTLAAVHQKCSERNGDEGSAARKKRNQNELERARIDRQTYQQ